MFFPQNQTTDSGHQAVRSKIRHTIGPKQHQSTRKKEVRRQQSGAGMISLQSSKKNIQKTVKQQMLLAKRKRANELNKTNRVRKRKHVNAPHEDGLLLIWITSKQEEQNSNGTATNRPTWKTESVSVN